MPVDNELQSSVLLTLRLKSLRTHCLTLSIKLKIMTEILPSKYPSLQLSGMSLHLIPMLIHTAKEVCTAMYIQHDSLTLVILLLSLLMVGAHLDPFCLQVASWFSPLPPKPASHVLNPMMSQLLLYGIRCFRDMILGDLDFVDLDPSWIRHPLRRKALYVFNCVVGRIEEEFAN